MSTVEFITCNPFQENTYLIYDDSLECIVIDPGVSNAYEQQMLTQLISSKRLKPVQLINTHCHIDHVLGNKFVADTFQLELGIHEKELVMLEAAVDRSMNWGVSYDPSPAPSYYIKPGDLLHFGSTELEVRFVPGHAPGHLVFVNHQDGYVIAGDTLFKGSIGRTDLMFGDFDVLAKSIQTELYTLPDHFKVYCGHGDYTTIGEEKRTNPFVRP